MECCDGLAPRKVPGRLVAHWLGRLVIVQILWHLSFGLEPGDATDSLPS